MMGMKKRMKRGGKAMKKRVKKKIGGNIGGTKALRRNEPQGLMTDRQKSESQTPNKRPPARTKTPKGSTLKNRQRSNVKGVKNPVRSKDGKIVRSNGKAVTFGGANKGGAKSREGRMGGGMMKKRMKRGGKAK